MSAHSDFRGSDVRFGDCGSTCIGGDQGSEEIDPNDLDNARDHLYRSNRGASPIGRVPCGVVMDEQLSWSRWSKKKEMLYARRLAARGQNACCSKEWHLSG
jgi:hypothetical protein